MFSDLVSQIITIFVQAFFVTSVGWITWFAIQDIRR